MSVDLLATVERLKQHDLLQDSSLALPHRHQINDIAVLEDALQEAGQICVELTRLGAPMGFLDVGGGLGIDYDGSRTTPPLPVSLRNYASDVVVQCGNAEPNGVDVQRW